MGISFVIFMAIFIRCCAIHTPSSNPNLPKNLQFSETLRRPVRSLQKQVWMLDTKEARMYYIHTYIGSRQGNWQKDVTAWGKFVIVETWDC